MNTDPSPRCSEPSAHSRRGPAERMVNARIVKQSVTNLSNSYWRNFCLANVIFLPAHWRRQAGGCPRLSAGGSVSHRALHRRIIHTGSHRRKTSRNFLIASLLCEISWRMIGGNGEVGCPILYKRSKTGALLSGLLWRASSLPSSSPIKMRRIVTLCHHTSAAQ